jgi:hypothetical protein
MSVRPNDRWHNVNGVGTIEQIQWEYANQTSSLDVEKLSEDFKIELKKAIANADLPIILLLYDNKGLISIAASKLKSCKVTTFESWLT